MHNLNGKVAIVNSWCKWIRVSFYKSLLTNRVIHVIAGYIEKGQDEANTLGDNRNIRFFKVDVSNEQQVKETTAQKVNWFGQVDIANAGILSDTITVDGGYTAK
ncbi:hypothetical protein [Lysinibacillus sp. JNUCC 51]|uniref:hypothetical protein n=1 Tax=Lysinibacillus sp. JNUCC-51 TaxID=2792479 RepID=UPI0019351FBC|nr:hypothetical protein JNUCC51_24545 [Lysinibacillus sp. JNUCC-51]